jgi:hypothetical protein
MRVTGHNCFCHVPCPAFLLSYSLHAAWTVLYWKRGRGQILFHVSSALMKLMSILPVCVLILLSLSQSESLRISCKVHPAQLTNRLCGQSCYTMIARLPYDFSTCIYERISGLQVDNVSPIVKNVSATVSACRSVTPVTY